MLRFGNQFNTKSFFARAALIFLAVLMLGTGVMWAQDNLAVAISTDRDVYQLGEPVAVTYTVTNQTGETIHLEGTSCIPLFNLIAYNADGQEIWNAAKCPSCCCTCCNCAIFLIQRDVPIGQTAYANDTTWRQIKITGPGPCGCLTEPVRAGLYYLIGQLSDTVISDPIAIEIQ